MRVLTFGKITRLRIKNIEGVFQNKGYYMPTPHGMGINVVVVV